MADPDKALAAFKAMKEKHQRKTIGECEECARELTSEDEEEGYCIRCGLKPLSWDCNHQWVEGNFRSADGQHWGLKCRTCGELEDEG